MANSKWLIITLFVSVFFVFILKAQDNVVDEVIWIVGDDAILKSDVENTRLEMQINGERFPGGDPYCVIPEQIAIQKLYIHQAKLDSVIPNESEVTQYVDQWINNVTKEIGSKEKLEEYFNKPLAQIREERRESIRDMLMTREVQKNIVGTVKLTPSDVRRYYMGISQDSLPFIPITVEVEVITAEPKVSLEEIDNIKGKLRDFTDQINKGEMEFSTLARLWSEDGSARYGGELGFMGKAEFVPEFAAVAFSLNDPKKVSRIVETEYGYHIIQLIEKRGDRMNVRHILLRPKISQSELNEATSRIDSIRMDIENKKFTFEEAATYLSADKDTRNNRGLMVNQNIQSDNAGTSRFEMEELPPEIGKVIYEMKEGDVSKPFTMVNSKQKEVIAIVKLKSRIEGHKANISDDYQALRAIVEERKRQEILNNWMAQKQKDTYIHINDNWKNCDFQRDGWIK